jgi:hypothetical protein
MGSNGGAAETLVGGGRGGGVRARTGEEG